MQQQKRLDWNVMIVAIRKQLDEDTKLAKELLAGMESDCSLLEAIYFIRKSLVFLLKQYIEQKTVIVKSSKNISQNTPITEKQNA
jgi:hypothetical protein